MKSLPFYIPPAFIRSRGLNSFKIFSLSHDRRGRITFLFHLKASLLYFTAHEIPTLLYTTSLKTVPISRAEPPRIRIVHYRECPPDRKCGFQRFEMQVEDVYFLNIHPNFGLTSKNKNEKTKKEFAKRSCMGTTIERNYG